MADRKPSLSRRDVLTGAVALGSLVLVPRWLRADEPRAGAKRRTLVFLHLNGGNDGLNTVVPYKDPRYRALRPSLAIDAGQVRKISETLGLHPGLSGLETLWKRERLGIVNGVGYPQPNYSHFRATEIWYTAQPERTPVDGWLGRALDAGVSDKPLRAVALGQGGAAQPRVREPGRRHDDRLLAVPPAAGHGGRGGRVGRVPQPARPSGRGRRRGCAGDRGRRPHRKAEARDRDPSRAAWARSSARWWRCCGPTSTSSASNSPSAASTRTRRRRARTTACSPSWATTCASSRSSSRPPTCDERVVTVVFSEFGRRVTENLSAGTDHGSAGPVFVIGSGVAQTFHGDQPSLDDLDGENLRFTTDFRRIYAAAASGTASTWIRRPSSATTSPWSCSHEAPRPPRPGRVPVRARARRGARGRDRRSSPVRRSRSSTSTSCPLGEFEREDFRQAHPELSQRLQALASRIGGPRRSSPRPPRRRPRRRRSSARRSSGCRPRPTRPWPSCGTSCCPTG